MTEAEGSCADRELSCKHQPIWILFTALYRMKLLKVELAFVMFVMNKLLYNALCQQYYYLIDGSDILRNTSFVLPNGSFCLSSEMIDNYTNNSNSYKRDESFSYHLVAYGEIANAIPSVLVSLVLGPLMDRYGRKIGLILPMIGNILQGTFSIFIIRYTLDPYYFILARFIGGLFGDYPCILAASFSYIADISSRHWRSLRVAVLEAAAAYGGGIGTILTGYWLRKTHCDFIPLLWFFIGSKCYPWSVRPSAGSGIPQLQGEGTVKRQKQRTEGVCGGLLVVFSWLVLAFYLEAICQHTRYNRGHAKRPWGYSF